MAKKYSREWLTNQLSKNTRKTVEVYNLVFTDSTNAKFITAVAERVVQIAEKVYHIDDFEFLLEECGSDGMHTRVCAKISKNRYAFSTRKNLVEQKTTYDARNHVKPEEGYIGSVKCGFRCDFVDGEMWGKKMAQAIFLVYAEEITKFYPDWETHYNWQIHENN